jgi:putative phosphoesterase
MKIGVVSDTHITSPASVLPPGAMARFRKEKVGLILHAGDVAHESVLDALRAIAEVRAVAGNVDPPELRAKLPQKLVETVDGIRIGLIHGTGPPDRLGERLLLAFEGDEIRVLVYGHSHVPRNEKHNGVLLFNPGSLNSSRGGLRKTFGILTVEAGRVSGEIIRTG